MRFQPDLQHHNQRKYAADRSSRLTAFTLLELLVGLIIFSLVLLATNMVFHNALSLREKTQDRIDQRIPEEYAERFLRQDLQGIIFGPGAMTSELYSESSGGSQTRSDRLEIISTTGRPAQGGNQSDLQKVEYYLDDASLAYSSGMLSAMQSGNGNQSININQLTTQTGRTLYRLVTSNPLAISDAQLDYQPMLENVESFQVQLCDGESWQDSWDSETQSTNLPTAVRIRIIYAEPLGPNGQLRPTLTRSRKPTEWVIPVLTEYKQDLSEDEEEAGEF